jgi:hypothetical protein
MSDFRPDQVSFAKGDLKLHQDILGWILAIAVSRGRAPTRAGFKLGIIPANLPGDLVARVRWFHPSQFPDGASRLLYRVLAITKPSVDPKEVKFRGHTARPSPLDVTLEDMTGHELLDLDAEAKLQAAMVSIGMPAGQAASLVAGIA